MFPRRTSRVIRGSRERAFTLVEIMIVIAIIAVIMATGVPSMTRALSKDDLARAMKDTIEGCKTARDRAILQGVPWAFVVHSESGELRVEPAPQETEAACGRRHIGNQKHSAGIAVFRISAEARGRCHGAIDRCQFYRSHGCSRSESAIFSKWNVGRVHHCFRLERQTTNGDGRYRHGSGD
jgi:prepilin-type N-terminal cleavage/methylation domain-containing protein